MRGISPVIATVIILAVTVAIAVAVIGWITGLFGATTSGTEQLQIYPDSYINATKVDNVANATLHLHIVNKGNDLTIYKIVTCRETISNFANKYTLRNTDIKINETSQFNGTDKDIVINSGDEKWLIVKLKKTYTAGTSCDVKIYTKAGNVFTAVVNVIS